MNIKANRKNVTNDVHMNCSRKNDYVRGMPGNVASRRILTKMAASVSHRIFLGNIKNFCRYKSPIYMFIYHTKKQAENIPRSLSYMLLKTLFYFISQCTSVPYLEIELCK